MQDKTSDFVGKTVVVTGGADGFGKEFCLAFSQFGANIVILDTDIQKAERLAEDIQSTGGKAMAIACDISDEKTVISAMEAANITFGGIDVLINNAALHLRKYNQPFSTLTHDEHRQLLDVNIMGVINCTLAAKSGLANKGGGVIINISSIASYYCGTPYGVSKLAVRGLTVAFAQEFSDSHIRVNCIAPGLMATPAALADQGEAKFADFVQNRQQIKRRGEMSDIVNAAIFLSSQEGSFMTGETLKVSGGYPLSA